MPFSFEIFRFQALLGLCQKVFDNVSKLPSLYENNPKIVEKYRSETQQYIKYVAPCSEVYGEKVFSEEQEMENAAVQKQSYLLLF